MDVSERVGREIFDEEGIGIQNEGEEEAGLVNRCTVMESYKVTCPIIVERYVSIH